MDYRENSPTAYTQWLIDFATSKGFTKSEMREAIIPGSPPTFDWNNLPICCYVSLLNWLADKLEDDCFGLTLADSIEFHVFGGSTAMVYHAHDLRQCCELLASYDQAVSLATIVNFDDIDKFRSLIEYKILVPEYIDTTHEITLSAASLVKFFRKHLDENWMPLEVNFPFSRPRKCEMYNRFFGPNISFDSASTSILLDNHDLSSPISSASPYLLEVLRKHCEATLQVYKQRTDLIERTRNFIACTIGSSDCNAEFASRKFFMSRRNFTRKLHERDTNFRDLKNDVTLDISKKLLSNSDANISEIAAQLGFKDSSSFFRAFKRSSGMSPSSYRRTYSKKS